MQNSVMRAPLFVLLFGLGALAMLVPAVFAFSESDWLSVRIFTAYSATGLTIAVLMALAMQRGDEGHGIRGLISSFAGFLAFAPAYYALPLRDLSEVGFIDAWFEMLSCLTTSGGMVVEAPEELRAALNLWRGICGWLGGASVLLFGAVMLSQLVPRHAARHVGPRASSEAARTRTLITLAAGRIFPAYLGLTLCVMIGLLLAGEQPFVAVMHAMGAASTSGISPISGYYLAQSGFWGEVVVALGLCAALSGAVLYRFNGKALFTLRQDRELRLAFWLVLAVAGVLSLGALGGLWTSQDPWRFVQFLAALWGAGFTALSFLTTTGFESRAWITVSAQSGLTSPGIVLMGLAAIGGGLATTAGGIKLMRLRTLLEDTRSEINRLTSPNLVEGRSRRVLPQVDVLSVWVTVVLFVAAFAGLMLFFTLYGLPVDVAMALAAAALSNTSQVAVMASDTPVTLAALPLACKIGVMLGMVAGRLEIIALFAAFVPRRPKR